MKKKKILITVIVIGILIALCLLFSIIFAVINMGNSTILSNITINNIDVSGKTEDEAKSILTDLVQKKIQSKLSLIYENSDENSSTSEESSTDNTESDTTIDLSNLNINYDISSAVEKAYSIGRKGNIFKNNFSIIKLMFSHKNIDINVTYDEKTLNSIAENSISNLPNKLISNSYYIENNKLIITRGTSGLVLDTNEFKTSFDNILYNLSSTETDFIIPTLTSDPDDIDLEAIHSDVYKEPVNAYYEKDPFKVYTEVEGIDFDIEKAQKLIDESPTKTEYSIDLIYTAPEITIKDLDIDVFPDTLATFSTRYDASNKDRSTNLRLAAEKINGTILSPDEEFSYNKVVGERTIAAGYKEAKIYAGGQVVDGLGGGICQISSTLYNAVIFANLEVTDRSNHQFVTSYVKAGRDATVVYGSIDFKFKNTRSYPIKINMSVSNGIAKVEILGIKEDEEYDISFDVETISTSKYSIKYVDDETLPVGTEKVKQSGANGLTVNVYKVVKQNGVTKSKTLISKDTYKAMTRIILKGTKGATSNSSDSSSQSSNSSNSNNNSSNSNSSPTDSGENSTSYDNSSNQTNTDSSTDNSESTATNTN